MLRDRSNAHARRRCTRPQPGRGGMRVLERVPHVYSSLRGTRVAGGGGEIFGPTRAHRGAARWGWNTR